MNYRIRRIRKSDNPFLEQLIRQVLLEIDGPQARGFYDELMLGMLNEQFSQDGSAYFVVQGDKILYGGMGYAPLKRAQKAICELQRAFLLPDARGRGIGKTLLEKCIEEAQKDGYQQMYLETASHQREAIGLFLKMGFESLEKPLGSTGHQLVDRWMLMDL